MTRLHPDRTIETVAGDGGIDPVFVGNVSVTTSPVSPPTLEAGLVLLDPVTSIVSRDLNKEGK